MLIVIKIFRHFFADFSHFADISTPICLGGMIDEAGSRKAKGQAKCRRGSCDFRKW